jgi:GT2 family glycosyltransferase
MSASRIIDQANHESNFIIEEDPIFNLAVIIPAYNRWEETADCLERLFHDVYPAKRIFLIDDGSTDGTTERCRERFPGVEILHGNGDLWWSGAINLGIEAALRSDVDLVLWLNNDNLVEPETIPRLIEVYRRCPPRSVICAENRSTMTGKLEWQGEPPFWHPEAHAWKADQEREPTFSLTHPPGGRGVLIPTVCFREVGVVDEDQFPHYWADHDFHYRAMERGYRYLLVRGATVWNRPNPPRFEGIAPFTLAWSWSYLTSRRSPMNLLTLYRLWRRHLSPPEYRQMFGGYVWRSLHWFLTGMIARRRWLHHGLRRLKRCWLLLGTGRAT